MVNQSGAMTYSFKVGKLKKKEKQIRTNSCILAEKQNIMQDQRTMRYKIMTFPSCDIAFVEVSMLSSGVQFCIAKIYDVGRIFLVA